MTARRLIDEWRARHPGRTVPDLDELLDALAAREEHLYELLQAQIRQIEDVLVELDDEDDK